MLIHNDKYHRKILTKRSKLFILRVQDFKLIYLSYFLYMLTCYADRFDACIIVIYKICVLNLLLMLRRKYLLIEYSSTNSQHSLV